MKNNTVLLAFSGGLDTSFCVKYLIHEKKCTVYSAVVNTGGFNAKELQAIEEKAYALGVEKHFTLEETEHYYKDLVRYLIYGNILKNGTYPLSVSAERVHQAGALAQLAKKLDVASIAHGSTGAGNDQIRFDLAFQLLVPDLKIITPIRDLKLSRQDEIEYLNKYGVNMEWKSAKYSINKGLWGTSIGGEETLTSHLPLPDSAFTKLKTDTKSSPLIISFKQGEIAAVNGEEMSPVKAIQTIEEIGKSYGIGRDIHVGDTIIGIKGRVGFEAAAALLIIKAHAHLEKHTLTKWQIHWKEQLANWYGMFIHEAQYAEPVMRNIETFLADSQHYVTGTVTLTLHPYYFQINGIESEHDLMHPGFGVYGEMNKTWTGEDVKGFTKVLGNSIQIFNKVNQLV